jgi:hypothetical protein
MAGHASSPGVGGEGEGGEWGAARGRHGGAVGGGGSSAHGCSVWSCSCCVREEEDVGKKGKRRERKRKGKKKWKIDKSGNFRGEK